MPLKKTQIELKEIVDKLFDDYVERKRTRSLYKTGLNIPKRLLIFYYQLNSENRHLDETAENFQEQERGGHQDAGPSCHPRDSESSGCPHNDCKHPI